MDRRRRYRPLRERKPSAFRQGMGIGCGIMFVYVVAVFSVIALMFITLTHC